MFEKVKEILGSEAFKLLEDYAPTIVLQLKDISNLNSSSVAIFIFQMLIGLFNHTHPNLKLLGTRMSLDPDVIKKLMLLEHRFCQTMDAVLPIGT